MSYLPHALMFDSPQSFARYLSATDLEWAQGVTLHHTWRPNLAMRPEGFTAQHILNLRSYYEKDLGWSAGPHFFVDDKRVWVFCDPNKPGVHAKSYNRDHLAIEVLGNYDKDQDDPFSGRGHDAWKNAAWATAALLEQMGQLAGFNFHRHDPRTDKTCPGTQVEEAWFEALVNAALETGDAAPEEDEVIDRKAVVACIEAIEWQLGKLRDLL